jgi:hypothetical protein
MMWPAEDAREVPDGLGIRIAAALAWVVLTRDTLASRSRLRGG